MSQVFGISFREFNMKYIHVNYTFHNVVKTYILSFEIKQWNGIANKVKRRKHMN